MGIKRVAADVWATRKKHLMIAALAVVIGLSGMSMFWQLMYPPERALPAFHIGGIDVGHKDRTAIMTQLADYAQNGEVTIKSPSKEWKVKWQSVGISVDP
jgi:hypothetical protein